jgi:uncharacterized protein YjbJ (UPF0337 family)
MAAKGCCEQHMLMRKRFAPRQWSEPSPTDPGTGTTSTAASAFFLVVWPEENRKDWNRIEGNWKEVKGKVKEKWSKLTDDDLTEINGKRDQLEGRLQQRYGYAKDQAREDFDTWISTLP